jgi:hypothetical protein
MECLGSKTATKQPRRWHGLQSRASLNFAFSKNLVNFTKFSQKKKRK